MDLSGIPEDKLRECVEASLEPMAEIIGNVFAAGFNAALEMMGVAIAGNPSEAAPSEPASPSSVEATLPSGATIRVAVQPS